MGDGARMGAEGSLRKEVAAAVAAEAEEEEVRARCGHRRRRP